jgi:adenine-specific DNA-methyltransferase
MHLTDYHAKYFAYELTKRCPSDSTEKLTGTLVDDQDEIDRQRECLIAEIEGKLQ